MNPWPKLSWQQGWIQGRSQEIKVSHIQGAIQSHHVARCIHGDWWGTCTVNLVGDSFQLLPEHTFLYLECFKDIPCLLDTTYERGLQALPPSPPSTLLLCFRVLFWVIGVLCIDTWRHLLAKAASDSFSRPCCSCPVLLATLCSYSASSLSFLRWMRVMPWPVMITN